MPLIGSAPTRTSYPFPTCHSTHFLSQERVLMNPFQKMEEPRTTKFFSLSHDTNVLFFKYLLIITWCQIPFPCRTNKRFFNLREILNQEIFLIPQPLASFGHEWRFQLTRWYLLFSLEEPHNKEKIILMSLTRTETGKGASAN